jgi:hypothetical protein
MSVYSLKFYNPDMRTVLVTDTTTNETLVPGRNKVKVYFDDVIVVNIPKQFNPMQCSRYLKTSLRQLIDGDFLYIDIDTIICESLCGIDGIDVDLGAVPAAHDINSSIINGGLMLSRNSKISCSLYERWHKLWLNDVQNGISTDQHSLEIANVELGNVIAKIPDIWNCQLKYGGHKFLDKAKIVHYFASVNSSIKSVFEQNSFLEIIKTNDEISYEQNFVIKNARLYLSYEFLPMDYKKGFCLVQLFCYYPSMFEWLNCLAHIALFVGERSKWLKCKLAKRRK